jgi:cytochrome c
VRAASWKARPFSAVALAGATIAVVLDVATAAGAERVSGDRALGEYLSSECVTCHQATGKFAGIPPIVGWPEASFIDVMKEYQHKKRPNPVMQMIAGRLSEEEIASLAVYFGSLKAAR